ncbi:MAG: DHH family phosphoesterase [Bacillota bacterium]
MNNLNSIGELIKKRDHFILIGHIDFDADCIGSLFGLKWILDKLKKNSIILINEELDKYDFIDIDNEDYQFFDEFKLNKNINYNIIALDSGDADRLDQGKNYLDSFPVFNIDHHEDNTLFGDYNYVNPDRAAAALIIYELAKKLNVNIDIKIGEAILMGIIGDTGSFRYSNTDIDVLEVTTELMKKGVDLYKINRMLYSRNSYKSVLFKGLALSTIKRSNDGKIAWVTASKEIFDKAEMDEIDSMNIVNYARDIKNVEVGISFTEKNNEIKVSFRSNEYCKVNEIAAKFSGGGHPRAAGCTIKGELSEVKERVIDEVQEHV